MTILESLIVPLLIDDKNYNEGISKAQKSAIKFNDNLSKIGGVVLGGVVAGFTAVGAGILSTIQPASDLAETGNKITTIFGGSSDKVNEFAKNSARDLGMSKQSALDAAAGFGVYANSAGLAGEEFANWSTNLVGLSSDLASFYNTTPEEASAAIQAALRGETEPMRKYGVMLDDNTMRQKAFEMGLIKSTKEALTPQNKVLVANQLILEKTSVAQGDFAKTSGGLANQGRIITATFENLRTTIGTALLPVVTQLATTFGKFLSDPAFEKGVTNIANGIGLLATNAVSYLPQVFTVFQNLFSFLQNNQGVVVAILGTLGLAVASFAITAILPLLPIIATFGLIAGAIYLLYQAWTTNFGGIQQIVGDFWKSIQPTFETLSVWFKENLPGALKIMGDVWNSIIKFAGEVLAAWFTNTISSIKIIGETWTNTLLPALKNVWAFMNEYLFPLFQAIGEFLSAGFSLAITALAGLWQNILLPALKDAYKWLNENVLPVLKDIGNWINDKLAPAFGWLKDKIREATDTFRRLADAIRSLTLPSWLTPGSPTPLQIAVEGLGKTLRNVARTALPEFGAQLNISGAISPMAQNIQSNQNDFSGLADAIGNNKIDSKQLARDITNAILQGI